jgi:8-oxo-dGTP pyrophosphatase MutT (NUDIX family)/phosphohistidine phosphatase SixA
MTGLTVREADLPAPREAKPTLAAGAVVTREHPIRGTEVVIIHRKRYDDWTLPKGKVEAGESLPACAVREVWEETGVKIRLGVPLDTIRYQAGKAGLKQVEYWGGTPLQIVRRAPDAEVDVVSWLPVRAALARLTYSPDHFLVQQYLEQPVATPMILVRHAKAMDRKDWTKKDAARPLTARGRRQARMLMPMLGAYGISGLVSSTSTRCVSTLQPYAEASGLSTSTYSQLSEEEGTDNPRVVAKLITKIRAALLRRDEPTAICVHRPVLPHILDALEMAPVTLATGAFLVSHLTRDGTVHAVERHAAAT